MKSSGVKALLAKMSLEDKLQQLTQVNANFINYDDSTEVTGPEGELGITAQELEGVGSILNFGYAKIARGIQKKLIETDKLPALFMMDVVHGCETIYPIPLAMGATFDTDLMRDCAAMAARESKARGIDVTFAPMVDLVRDARWGRVMESTGEDVYLNGLFATAQVEGFQSEGIAACVKHFAAYGAPEAGRDYNTVDMSERTLRQTYLPAYKAAVDAGVQLVMTSFNVFDGVPAVGNKKLVKDILRDEWGFDGVVITDYKAIWEQKIHGVAEDDKECAYKAFTATNDIEMMSATYIKEMKALLDEGKVTLSQIDEAVERVLKLKKDLGVLDNPYVRCGKTQEESDEAHAKNVLTPAHRALARKAAEKSAVLLKNDGVLPFSDKAQKIAVIGPFGNTGEILGTWSCYGNKNDTVTVMQGVQNAAPTATVAYAKGVDGEINAKVDQALLEEAVRLAKESEGVILTLGEPQGDSGEGASKQNLELTEAQYALLDAVLTVNKNTVVLLFTGRPLALQRLQDKAPAILCMWQPGTEGGNAAANLLFGKVIPEGKLTMSFPLITGQCPVHYDSFRTGRPREKGMGPRYCSAYIDGPNEPLYPFGYGLTYTTFEYSKLTISKDILHRGEEIEAFATVKNTGNCTATETVQMYIHDCVGSVVRPLKELKGYQKVTLAAGEEKCVSFTITEEMLKFYNAELQFVAEEGKFLVFIGGDSTCERSVKFLLA